MSEWVKQELSAVQKEDGWHIVLKDSDGKETVGEHPWPTKDRAEMHIHKMLSDFEKENPGCLKLSQ